jgi:zinc transport system ATP-binding protein
VQVGPVIKLIIRFPSFSGRDPHHRGGPMSEVTMKPMNRERYRSTSDHLLLSVRDLNVTFGKRKIIHDLNFEIDEGDCLAIIGPNGAGKTVLLKTLLHLIPCTGEIRWSHQARLGYVPQKIAADRQLPLSARDLLLAKVRFLRLPITELQQVSGELGLTKELLNSNIGTLSGGQFQKVLIAFALLGRPNVLLFDEPTASLDELTEERIYERLRSLQKDRGMTILLVSHDLSVVYRSANMVLCLSKGKPCMGPPREILTPAMLQELYAAPPQYYEHVHHHGAVQAAAETSRETNKC